VETADPATPLLSLFFKRHRDDYYRRSTLCGRWRLGGWFDFFLDGFATIADEAVASAGSRSRSWPRIARTCRA
jgi:hypothetical protein